MINYSFIVSDDDFITKRILNNSLESSIEIVRENMISLINIEDLILFDADFDYLATKKETLKELKLKIYRNGIFKLNRTLNLQTGKFDYLNKVCVLKVEIPETDLVQSVLDNLETEYDVLETEIFTANVEYSTYAIVLWQSGNVPSLQFEDYYLDPTQEQDQDIPAWSGTKQYSFIVNLNLIGNVETFVSYNGEIYHCLQANINEIPGTSAAWAINAPKNFTRRYVKEVCVNTFPGAFLYNNTIDLFSNFSDLGETLFSYYPSRDYFEKCKFYKSNYFTQIIQRSYTQGRKIENVFENILAKINTNILFEKLTGSNCWAKYLIDSSDYNKIYVYDKSDVKLPTATQKAYFEKLELNELFKLMKHHFNLDWHINQAGYFQFIHPNDTEFFSVEGLNLTNYQNRDVSEGLMQFQKKQPKICKSEIWRCEKTANPIFSEQTIIYGSKGTIITSDLQIVSNDISEMTNGNESQISNDGVCLMAVDGSNNVKEYDYIVNGFMSLERLIVNHSQQERPQKFGTFNGVDYEFTTEGSDDFGTFIVHDINIFDVDLLKIVKTKISDLLGFTGLRITALKQNLGSDFVEIYTEK